MRKSLASLVGNIGNGIGLGGTPSVRIRDMNDEGERESGDYEVSSRRGTYGLTTPSRPLGLPPPLPYSGGGRNVNHREVESTRNHESVNSVTIPSSMENTKILTPFTLKRNQRGEGGDHNPSLDGSMIVGESFFKTSSHLGGKTPQTIKSHVRIKSAGLTNTPSRILNSAGKVGAGSSNNNNSAGGGIFMGVLGTDNDIISSIFTPQSSGKARFLPVLPTSPRREMSENINVKSNLSLSSKEVVSSSTMSLPVEKEEGFESLEVFRRRLNEKNQEVHFLKKTVKDLEARIVSLESKERMLVEMEVSSKKRLEEFLVERHEQAEQIGDLKKEILQLQEEKENVLKENECLSGNYEVKCFEITKLYEQINNIQNTYKDNFTTKYLTPLKNLLYESILEVEKKMGNETIMNVEFGRTDMEMDAIIRTLHEYIQNFKRFVSLKIDQDYNIIENLHFELSNVNKDLLELRREYFDLKKAYDSVCLTSSRQNSSSAGDETGDMEPCNSGSGVDVQFEDLEEPEQKTDSMLDSNAEIDSKSDNLSDQQDNSSTASGGLFLGPNRLQLGLANLAKSLLGYTCMNRGTSLLINGLSRARNHSSNVESKPRKVLKRIDKNSKLENVEKIINKTKKKTGSLLKSSSSLSDEKVGRLSNKTSISKKTTKTLKKDARLKALNDDDANTDAGIDNTVLATSADTNTDISLGTDIALTKSTDVNTDSGTGTALAASTEDNMTSKTSVDADSNKTSRKTKASKGAKSKTRGGKVAAGEDSSGLEKDAKKKPMKKSSKAANSKTSQDQQVLAGKEESQDTKKTKPTTKKTITKKKK